jgi:3-keto-disaccharide hydrolase
MVIGHGVSMIRKIRRPTVTAVLARFAAVVLQAADTDFVPLLNGRNLDGWQVDTAGIWSVQDGMIVGKHEGLAYNDFLRTAAKYRDFILVLKFRLSTAEATAGFSSGANRFRTRMKSRAIKPTSGSNTGAVSTTSPVAIASWCKLLPQR